MSYCSKFIEPFNRDIKTWGNNIFSSLLIYVLNDLSVTLDKLAFGLL